MILLDTQVVLWWLADDVRLGAGSRDAIADRSERVRVSAVSVFEVETKRRIGKLDAPPNLVDAVTAEGFELMVLDADHAELAGTLDWAHRDPFDRLLVAQSRRSTAPILTADGRILDHEPTALDART
ncbi:MAG: type II toxin-antitoxin system VapC family toxin [Ilumatobacteraceae bacterium]